jgi:hypothetical protein
VACEVVKKESDVRPFVNSPRPFVDESLNGFLGRSAKHYAMHSVSHLLEGCGAKFSNLSELHRSGHGLEAVALMFGLDSSELNVRRYRPAARSISSIVFGRNEVKRTFLSVRVPRIAPLTFKRIGYYRMCWDLDFVVADPDTGERLISRCSTCHASLHWNRPEFLFCFDCNTPFAQTSPSIVSSDVRLATAFFSGLLSFEKVVANDARSNFSPELRRVPPTLLLQALFELASRPISERKGRGGVPAELDWEKGLVRMLQISIGWPYAVLGLINEITSGGRRREDKSASGFQFGQMRKVLPAWGPIPDIQGVLIPIARALESGKTEAFHPHPRFVARDGILPTLVRPDEVVPPYDWFQNRAADLSVVTATSNYNDFVEELKELASPEMIKIRWGLDSDLVSELTSAGYLRRVDEEYRSIFGSEGPLYRISEITNFFTSLRDRYEAAPRNTRRVGFTAIASRIKYKVNAPHARLIGAVLDGSFRPIRLKDKARTGLECLQFGYERANTWIDEQIRLAPVKLTGSQ